MPCTFMLRLVVQWTKRAKDGGLVMHDGRWSRDVLIAGASFVVMLGVLFAGAWVFRLASVNRPVAVALRGAGEVLGHRLTAVGGTNRLTVVLRPGTDLALADRDLRARLAAAGAAGVDLRFRAPVGDPKLETVFEAMGAILAQGMSTGRFVPMVAAAQRLAAAHGDRVGVVVTTRRVYVTLTRGRAALYEVLQRTGGAGA